ncbi:bifunctional hydroxymethylpyrimidine kinase/phosphomethylpyrimidine kinase [Tabrizicola oligotrophica]|uniref:hydroxymethylpyrimidine kinase n=1 Tax=Tabrizicola oligotrophica TaxID=2710650 RepID=A0A6M0QRS3_9RHOB|nr:hydroxymethylpyrimidine/phosphomethylpyrimidine kinase [Tabrizicola oligotrophica]NEY90106.1 hydroxymethylpyrimidine/phosphomethylpyrimidine kinase [Tabrizicola oligotrophica]
MTAPVLFIGGMDSSGGAGLLRDCATAAEFGVLARVAVTAITAQTDRAVTAVQPVAPGVVSAQILAAGQIAAVKIGMLCTAPVVQAVAACLPNAPCILDPVLRSSSGHDLIDAAGADALLHQLLPNVDLLTPNLPELALLARLSGCAARHEAARVEGLFRLGCRAVLVKGGHAAFGKVCEDRLYLPGAPPTPFRAPRLKAALRGTGCQLASAIAAQIALGRSLEAAIGGAKQAVQRRFRAAVDQESLPSI